MQATLEEFRFALQDLRSFVNTIDIVESAVHEAMDGARTIRRQLDHAAFVVVVYAIFERFVEDLAWELARRQADKLDYVNLPTSLKKKHLKISADLIVRGRLGEGRYQGVVAPDLIENLHMCLSATSPYELNRWAIVHHEGNLRPSVIDELLRTVGLDAAMTKLARAAPIIEWVRESENPTPDFNRCLAKTTAKLEDFVERRNEVAHGRFDIGEVFSTASMKDILLFFEACGDGLFQVAAEAYLKRCFVDEGRTELLVVSEGPYQNRSVIVVFKPDIIVNVGHPIVAIREDRLTWGRVESLQVEGTPLESTDTVAKDKTVGIRLDFRLPKKADVFALTETEDAVFEEMPSHIKIGTEEQIE